MFTKEQIDAVRAVYPTLTDAQIVESLEKAEKARAKKKAKAGEIKGATPTIGAEVPVAVASAAAAPAPAPAPALSQGDFAIRAIRKLRRPPFKGIHTRYSGFNNAFGKYFQLDNAAVVTAVLKLVDAGVVDGRLCKGGYMLYEKGMAPASTHKDALAEILAE